MDYAHHLYWQNSIFGKNKHDCMAFNFSLEFLLTGVQEHKGLLANANSAGEPCPQEDKDGGRKGACL